MFNPTVMKNVARHGSPHCWPWSHQPLACWGISNPKTVEAAAGVIVAPKVSIDGVKKRDDDEEEPHG